MRHVHLVCFLILSMTMSSCSNNKADNELIGHWKSIDTTKSASVEFTKESLVIFDAASRDLLDWTPLKMFKELNVTPSRNAMTFNVTDKNHIEIYVDTTALMETLSAKSNGSSNTNDRKSFLPKETFSFALADGELTLTAPNGKSLKMRRSQ